MLLVQFLKLKWLFGRKDEVLVETASLLKPAESVTEMLYCMMEGKYDNDTLRREFKKDVYRILCNSGYSIDASLELMNLVPVELGITERISWLEKKIKEKDQQSEDQTLDAYLDSEEDPEQEDMFP